MYTTKAGKHYLKKSAVPSIDPKESRTSTGTVEPISESVSESESIFDTPRKIDLKREIHDITIAKKKLTAKIKNVQRQNRKLKEKNESLILLVKSLKTKLLAKTKLMSNMKSCQLLAA